METPVYLFTGFLEAGKTRFLKEAVEKQSFSKNGNVLLLICEDGEIEYDVNALRKLKIFCEFIENENELSADNLLRLQKKHNAVIVLAEYNGMWQLQSFYTVMPDEWFVYQEMCLCDSQTITVFNKNMRSLVVDKFQSSDLVVFNRVDDSTDKETLHKLVRSVSRNADIVFDMTDGTVEYDDIEDPLPFDINSDVIVIEDKDFAIWYRDLVCDTEKYKDKKITFKGIVFNDDEIPRGSFFCGRHVMTCCADDISYSGIACDSKESSKLKTGSWVTITGVIHIMHHATYESEGPVIAVTSVIPSCAPDEPVASFY